MMQDQAHGLRRLFATSKTRFVPVVSNPRVMGAGVLLEGLCAAFSELNLTTLVVDAGIHSPQPSELAHVDLSNCIERLSPKVSYLAARGLPLRHVNTRGSCEAWLNAVESAAPQADVLLLHANARDLVRLLGRREVRPVLTSTLDPASLTDAYTSMKLLSQRSGLMTFDLLTAMAGTPKAAQRIAERLADTADSFLGAVVREAVWLDKRDPLNARATPALARLAAHQLVHPDDFAESGLGASPLAAEAHFQQAY